jgi:NADPH:quinone reductase-like Zn-dependent oxidoreductase
MIMADVPEIMRAIAINKNGKPKVLKYVNFKTPVPAEGEVLVKIHATSVNPNDLLYRKGDFIIRKPMPHILGSDLAGEIVELGEGVKGWNIGDRIIATFEMLGRERDGSYAEYCTVPADDLMKLPDDLDYQAAASAGASFVTAWVALVTNGKIKKADRVVIYSASSSIGAAAVQIAKAKGATVIAISQGEHAARLREIGATIVLDEAGMDIIRQVKVATDEQGATLVLNLSYKDTLQQSIDMLDYKGRVVIASARKTSDAKLNVMDVFLKNISIIGSYDKISTKDFEAILKGFASGKYQSVIDEVIPLSQTRQAHEKVEKKSTFGKVVLVPDSIIKANAKPSGWIAID